MVHACIVEEFKAADNACMHGADACVGGGSSIRGANARVSPIYGFISDAHHTFQHIAL